MIKTIDTNEITEEMFKAFRLGDDLSGKIFNLLEAAPEVKTRPIGTLFLGGIEGNEYGEIDVDLKSKALEALQEELVSSENPVVLEVYAHPPAVSEGWIRAIDEALVCHHIDVANATDTYEQAKDKLNKLLCVVQDIGAYFAKQEPAQGVPEFCGQIPVDQCRSLELAAWEGDDGNVYTHEEIRVLGDSEDAAIALFPLYRAVIQQKPSARQSAANCKTHPDAPHGFLRDASHTEGRYVCECEYWELASVPPAIERKPQLQRIAELTQQIEQLREALQALYDEQNGPPLIRDAARWEAAMELASKALEQTK